MAELESNLEFAIRRLNRIRWRLRNDYGLDDWETEDLIDRESRILDAIYEYEGPDAIEFDCETGQYRIKLK